MLGGIKRSQFGEYQVTCLYSIFVQRKWGGVIDYILYSARCSIGLHVILYLTLGSGSIDFESG